jgi:hypothetical protein
MIVERTGRVYIRKKEGGVYETVGRKKSVVPAKYSGWWGKKGFEVGGVGEYECVVRGTGEFECVVSGAGKFECVVSGRANLSER